MYPVYANESDPESLLNAINKLNDQNKNRMRDLKRQALDNNQKMEDLSDFKNKAETGKYKEGCKNDFKNIYKD